jgi:homoaconitase/3-isopropylmalate dehydratase large subunit
MNIAEKILAAHAGKKSVELGQFLMAKVDLVMTTDATGLISVQQFEKMGGQRVLNMAINAFQYDQRMSTPLGTPMVISYLFIPFGFTVLGLQFLARLIGNKNEEAP